MNPAAILHLISNLYDQLLAAQQRIEELEGQAPPGSNGSPDPDFATSRTGEG